MCSRADTHEHRRILRYYHVELGSGPISKLPAARTEPERVPCGVVEHVDGVPLDVGDGLDDELGNAIASVNFVRRARVGVHEQHLQLTAILGVDQARRVQNGDAVLEGQPRARQNEAGIARGNRDREAGRYERSTPSRLDRDLDIGAEVVPRIVVVRLVRQRGLSIEASDRNLHPTTLGDDGRPTTGLTVASTVRPAGIAFR